MAIISGILVAIFVITCILLIAIILLQPHYSESGLAGAFGGGGSDSFLGVKAISVASKITIILAIIFIVLAIVINKLPRTGSYQEGGLMSGEKPLPPKQEQSLTPTTPAPASTPQPPAESKPAQPASPPAQPTEKPPKPVEEKQPISPTPSGN